MAGMKLNYHFIASWDPSGLQSWNYWAFPGCIVSNSMALVYLKP